MQIARSNSSFSDAGTGMNGAETSASGLVCIKCSAVNAVSRKFCGECGASLFFDCEKCGSPHPGGERFCGSCGDDIATRMRERLNSLRQLLDSAKRLLDESKYEDALFALGNVARHKDVRLEGPVSQAKELLAVVPERRRQAAENASRRFEEAKRLLAAGEIAQAHETLEAVPPALRSQEMEELLRKAASADNEIVHLKREVKELYEAKRVEELIPKLDRLTQLVPDEGKYRTILDRACDAIVDRATKRYAANRFGDALADCRMLPVGYVESRDEVEKLFRQAEEMHFLERRLTSSVWTTPAVEAMTAALLQRAPEYDVAKQFAARLAERKRSRPADPRRSLTSWRKVTANEIEIPTEEHAYSRRVVLAEEMPSEAAKLWKAEPGRFFSAIGVAMQALGRSVVETRLEFEEKRSVLAGLSLFKEKCVGAWGIDCSPCSIKGALINVRDDGTVVLRDLYLSESPLKAIDEDYGGTTAAREALKEFKESRLPDRRSLDGIRVGACLPSDSMIGRWFGVPTTDKTALERIVAHEAKNQIPIPLDELRWDWQTFTGQKTDVISVAGEPAGTRAMAVAVRKTWLENWHNAFRYADVKPAIVQSDALALACYAHHEWNLTALPLPAQSKKGVQPHLVEDGVSLDLRENEAIALIDVGALHTNVVVAGDNLAWFRSFNVGSRRLTQRLAAAYQLTLAQAEVFKRDPSQVKRFARYYAAAQPAIEDFLVELDRSLRLFRNVYPDVSIRKRFLVGGGSRFDGYSAATVLGPDRFFEGS